MFSELKITIGTSTLKSEPFPRQRVAGLKRYAWKMNAIEALDRFLNQVLEPRKAKRYCDLILRPKGQKRFLGDLYHTVGDSFRAGLPNTPLTETQRCQPGFSYSESRGFGIAEASIDDGFDELMPDTGWLLIDSGGNFGIYQPEDMIGDQRQIVA